MSVRTAIYDILTANAPVLAQVSTRIFVGQCPQSTANPCIVFNMDMIADTFTKDNDSTLDTYLVQIDIYHNTVADEETLAGLVRDALQGYQGTINGTTVRGCRLSAEVENIDEDLYPIWSQDYEIKVER